MASPLSLSQVFYSVMRLSDLAAHWKTYFGRVIHYSQRPIFGLLPALNQGLQECGQKWPEIWTFICNSKPIWNGQAGSWLLLVQVRLTSGPSPKAHWLSACRCSRSPWASYHLTKLFFWDCWVIMLISGCRLLMEGWVSVIMSAIYRSLDWYLDQSWNTLKV